MRLKAAIEREKYVNSLVFKAIAEAQEQDNLDKAEALLKKYLLPKSWMVYRGGSHIALHRTDLKGRIAIIYDAGREYIPEPAEGAA